MAAAHAVRGVRYRSGIEPGRGTEGVSTLRDESRSYAGLGFKETSGSLLMSIIYLLPTETSGVKVSVLSLTLTVYSVPVVRSVPRPIASG